MMPKDLNLQKKDSHLFTPLIIDGFYTFTPKRRASKIITAITSNRWINPPPTLSENPPNHEITKTIIMISIKLIFFHLLSFLELLSVVKPSHLSKRFRLNKKNV